MYKIAALIFTLFIIVNASYPKANSPAYYGFAPDYQSHKKTSYNLAPHASYSGPSYSPKPSYIYAQPSQYQSYQEPASYEEKSGWSPYSFGYKVDDGYGNKQFQNEDENFCAQKNGDANGALPLNDLLNQSISDEYGTKKGSYGYTDAYGIYRQVDYIADGYGFRATVKTNEPGTAPQAPASTKWYAKPSPYVDNQAYASYAPASYLAPVSAYRAAPSSAYYAPKYSSKY